MLTEQEYIKKFKEDNPIEDCLGCGNGRYKWERVNGCIDLRYGYSTLVKAQKERIKAAKEGYSFYLLEQK